MKHKKIPYKLYPRQYINYYNEVFLFIVNRDILTNCTKKVIGDICQRFKRDDGTNNEA